MTQENFDIEKVMARMTHKIHGHMRRLGEPAEKTCKGCGQTKPIEKFYLLRRPNPAKGGYYETRSSRCRECEKKRMREYHKSVATLPEICRKEKKTESVPTCRENCEFYPCFRGIDAMKTNLALTCLRFKEKA